MSVMSQPYTRPNHPIEMDAERELQKHFKKENDGWKELDDVDPIRTLTYNTIYKLTTH